MSQQVIWKYSLEGIGRQRVDMPVGAKVLSVQMQDNALTVWALVNDRAKVLPRTFLVTGTGHEGEFDNMRHVGTVQLRGFVWHVFEEVVAL